MTFFIKRSSYTSSKRSTRSGKNVLPCSYAQIQSSSWGAPGIFTFREHWFSIPRRYLEYHFTPRNCFL